MTTTEQTGVIVARAAGVVLVVAGVATALQFLPFARPPGVSSGWTSYPPDTSISNLVGGLSTTYYEVSTAAAWYVPSVTMILSGLVMIFASQPIGRWMAKGLSGGSADGAG